MDKGARTFSKTFPKFGGNASCHPVA